MTAQTGDILFNGQRFSAFFFDMDGTILTSIRVAERIWGEWAVRHGIDPVAFLPTIHGVRAVETIARQNLPGVDAEAEAQRITEAEIADVDGVEAIGGAREFLQALPMDRWAIFTSAPKALALRRIQAAGLPEPKVIIAAEDVRLGKPAPEGYLLAAEKLGVNAADCLVFEDALRVYKPVKRQAQKSLSFPAPTLTTPGSSLVIPARKITMPCELRPTARVFSCS
ncbi:HAD-IA family hydrolase [Enterobacter sp. TMH.L2]